MNYAPHARIVLRYGVGILAGQSVGDALAADPDIVTVVESILLVGVMAITELWYAFAKKRGLPT